MLIPSLALAGGCDAPLISVEILTGMQSRLKDCNSVILYVEAVSNVRQSRHETLGEGSLSGLKRNVFGPYTPSTCVVRLSFPRYQVQGIGASHVCS
jgi:hypothetical protein